MKATFKLENDTQPPKTYKIDFDDGDLFIIETDSHNKEHPHFLQGNIKTPEKAMDVAMENYFEEVEIVGKSKPTDKNAFKTEAYKKVYG